MYQRVRVIGMMIGRNDLILYQGRWRRVLTVEEHAKYQRAMQVVLSNRERFIIADDVPREIKRKEKRHVRVCHR